MLAETPVLHVLSWQRFWAPLVAKVYDLLLAVGPLPRWRSRCRGKPSA
ncbi:hypothetical protein MPEAHAMD_6132 [Methylobacterium frigidaeris]|uniref:Uncharacterized protein n=1 Tax=Methylobacterium frigidaeris TaxID=2038277 RepID=A0AA37M8G4_9HYPH|nr:hypothetical protein MPEAHAMD_6132 [Methylobacterium frigidaeris]